jgi:hypothetical protein
VIEDHGYYRDCSQALDVRPEFSPRNLVVKAPFGQAGAVGLEQVHLLRLEDIFLGEVSHSLDPKAQYFVLDGSGDAELSANLPETNWPPYLTVQGVRATGDSGQLSPKTESLSGVTTMVLAARAGSVLNTEG